MADIADLAQEHIEAHAPHILAAYRKHVPPAANGFCLNCDADLSDNPGARFCDIDCMHDWERAMERARVNGDVS